MVKKTKSPVAEFEKALKELEKIVERMEQGEQTLEASLEDFERGMTLSKQCAESLKLAEQRVEKVVKKHAAFTTEPFDPEDEDS